MVERPRLSPRTVAPYFILVGLIHAFAVATRFDALAMKIPPAVGVALMIGQFPLILLSGYFEGRIDYGKQMAELPLWMRIKSKPVKIAFTFAFIYIACVALQTWNVSIGPIDPTPPAQWPLEKRAMWFAIFTAGMFFPFYLAATGALIPLLRFVTKPLRALPAAAGALIAIAVGGGIGILVFSLATNSKLKAFIAEIKGVFAAHPAIGVGITFASVFGPLLLGLLLGKKDADAAG
jgi:hypothetical protein